MATITQPKHINLPEWIEENKQYFLPPVCNKMMHQEGQMKVFCVGGPNQRKDYHIEVGEELFYMRKGDMVLKVVEHNKFRDVHIKEGQLFLLPGRIAHSPQRQADTVGLVIERDRAETELDGLRYYVEKNGQPTPERLYEEWFHVVDLGTQLAPVIKRFFASEQYKTGKPVPGSLPKVEVELDSARTLFEPIDLMPWIDAHRDEINSKGKKKIWEGEFQLHVFVYGKGKASDKSDTAETMIWQLEGESHITLGDGTKQKMKLNDTYLVPMGKEFIVEQKEGSSALVVYMDPTVKY